MRYEDTKKKEEDLGESQTPAETSQEVSGNIAKQENLETPQTGERTFDAEVDFFQEVVYNAGSRALNLLDENELTKGLAIKRRKETEEILRQLGTFRYNIGFAGPQSCGKSSLINAIIQYPLMPTCNLATTCTPVELIYSKEPRIIVKDEDHDGKIVFDRKCRSLSRVEFDKLIDYACKVMTVAVIENLQFFCDISILADAKNIRQYMHMDRNDPRQVALLFMILLTVYAHQNNKQMTKDELELNDLRVKTLAYFGIQKKTVNYLVIVQWDNPMLASGLMITDLPGLGSSAEDKKEGNVVIKGHDTITKEAVLRTDTMAFLSEPLVLADAVPALEAMISNASIRDAVSIEERIVPIMNKVDQLVGDQKVSAINMMLSMMRNAGANMDGRKVWETSSYCGEYSYKDVLDVKRSFYITREMFKLADKGYTQEKIERRLPLLVDDMECEYNNSGIEKLREFFRTSFIGKGKYQKTFSSVIALRALALDMIAPLRNVIKSNTALAKVNGDLARLALSYLEEAALTPLNDAQETEEAVDKLVREHLSIIEPMVEGATSKYETALSNAVDNYIERLRQITGKFKLTYLGFGNRARVDSGEPHNHELYQQLLNESEIFKVDLKEVNTVHASALRYCSNAVEKIYKSAQDILYEFQKSYPGIMRDCIEEYRGKADEDVITLMENLLPSLQQFVSSKILTADAAIQDMESNFQKIADNLALDVVGLNDMMVSVLLEMVKDKLGTIEGGWFTKKDYLIVDGANGLNMTISNLKLSEEDRARVRGLLTQKGSEVITSPLLKWYKDAEENVNSIMGALSLEFADQFKQIREDLEKKTEEVEEKIQNTKKLLEILQKIFSEMKNSIQPQLDTILELKDAGDSPLKGDMFEGMLEELGENYG